MRPRSGRASASSRSTPTASVCTMSDAAKQRAVFFEIHSGLPREGPGDAASTVRAYRAIGELPASAHILDAGCGPGAQTLDLAAVARGRITGVDNHRPYLET